MSETPKKPKYVCGKGKCPLCGKVGTIQIIRDKYSRVRHYTNILNGKPQFTYCHVSTEEAKRLIDLDRSLGQANRL